jgi:hypothetical protein
VTPVGKLFFGEYFRNSERDVVHVFGSDDRGNNWEIAYTFRKGEIRHTHGIFYDDFRKGCWVLTGDIGQECRIAFTEDNFRTLSTVFCGNQSVRAVSLIPLAEGLIVPTDTPLEENFIQLLDPKNGHIEPIHPLPGSGFYTATVGEYLLVSTGVEPSKVNRHNHAALFLSKDGGKTWSELYHQQKDLLPSKLFQYGVLVLPTGKSDPPFVYAYGRSLRKIDDYLLVWKLHQ